MLPGFTRMEVLQSSITTVHLPVTGSSTPAIPNSPFNSFLFFSPKKHRNMGTGAGRVRAVVRRVSKGNDR